MRAGLLTTGIILLVLGAIFYFLPSPESADTTGATVNTTTQSVQTATYATYDPYGNNADRNATNNDDESSIVAYDPYARTGQTNRTTSDPYINTADDTADDNTAENTGEDISDYIGGTATGARTNTSITTDDEMDDGTTARSTTTAASSEFTPVDYDGDGVATLYIIMVSPDQIRPATRTEIDEINQQLGMETTAMSDRATSDDTTDDTTTGAANRTSMTNGTNNRSNWTNTTGTRTATTGITNNDADDNTGTTGDGDDSGDTLAGVAKLQDEYETTAADGSADGVGVPSDGGLNDDAAVGTGSPTTAPAGAVNNSTTAVSGGDSSGTDESTTTATQVGNSVEQGAAAAGGFLNNPLVRTLALLSMILGAILTVLGLILPAPDERAAEDRTARTTGAAGRRVEYERETTTTSEHNERTEKRK